MWVQKKTQQNPSLIYIEFFNTGQSLGVFFYYMVDQWSTLNVN